MEQRLLVEGKNDMYVFTEICIKLGLATIKNYDTRIKYEKFIETGSWDKEFLRKITTILPLNDGNLNFGMILDADDDPYKKWHIVKNTLEENGFNNLPQDIPEGGIIIKQIDLPKIGIWIMPNNISSGYLEHFLFDLIPKNDKVLNDVLQIVENLVKKNLFSLTHRKKVELHTWLAWQKKPGLPFGTAIKAGYFDLDHPNVDLFIKWTKKIFKFN